MIRLIQHIRRSLAACRLGVRYGRTSRFMSGPSPGSIRWEGRRIPLALPEEHGVKAAFVEVFLDDVYRVGAMARSGWRPRGIVDVGANVGLFTLWAGLHFPGVPIDAYEPCERFRGALSENCASVGARAFPEGAWGTSGVGAYVEGGDSLGGKMVLAEIGEGRLLSLGEVLARARAPVDLIKIDAEGAEWSILGGRADLSRVACVLIEFHCGAGHRPGDIAGALAGAGLRCGWRARGMGDAWVICARGERG